MWFCLCAAVRFNLKDVQGVSLSSCSDGTECSHVHLDSEVSDKLQLVYCRPQSSISGTRCRLKPRAEARAGSLWEQRPLSPFSHWASPCQLYAQRRRWYQGTFKTANWPLFNQNTDKIKERRRFTSLDTRVRATQVEQQLQDELRGEKLPQAPDQNTRAWLVKLGVKDTLQLKSVNW